MNQPDKYRRLERFAAAATEARRQGEKDVLGPKFVRRLVDAEREAEQRPCDDGDVDILGFGAGVSSPLVHREDVLPSNAYSLAVQDCACPLRQELGQLTRSRHDDIRQKREEDLAARLI